MDFPLSADNKQLGSFSPGWLKKNLQKRQAPHPQWLVHYAIISAIITPLRHAMDTRSMRAIQKEVGSMAG
jgi:hypothetical protein